MAPPAGHIRPGRYLGVFALIVIALYVLVFATGDHKPVPRLGIDLRGGTTVTLTARSVNNKPPTQSQLDQAQQIIQTRVNGLGVSGAQVVRSGNNIVITVPGNQGEEAKNLGQTAKLYFRPVEQQVAATTTKPSSPLSVADQQCLGIAPRTDNPQVLTPQQQSALVKSCQTLRQTTDATQQQTVLAELNCAANAFPADPLQGNDDPTKPLVACDQNHQYKYLLGPSFLDGTQIHDASSGQDPNGPGYAVNLTFNSSGKNNGAGIWANYTAQHIGEQAAFVLDTQVVSAPQIQSAISGRTTEITGNFNQVEAQQLANVLKYGSLPVAFIPSNAESISASLGLTSLVAGLVAGGIGLLLVVVYCLFYYRVLGLLTLLSLVLSGVTVYGVLVLLGRWIGYSLDLAGIAGLIIAIGITADSFVIFFERLKDEVRDGRTFRSAVPRAWVRARRTILASDAVSFLAAVVLYVIAVSDVQGFAFTLGMSTLLDLLIVFLVTHPLVVLAARSKRLSQPTMSGLGAVQRAGAQLRASRSSVGAGSGPKGA